MKNLLLSLALFAAVALSGCEKPQDTLQTLQSEVSSYSANPSEEAAAKIDANFTKLDKQIAQLREAGQAEDAATISNQRDALQAQYAAARMTASLLKAKEAAANVGEAFRKAGEAFGQALQGSSTNQE